ncbi:polysaccharide deacetylase family protein [Starkeya sp. ORNL1]|uniref:polysaccharide deacetylase family protein n=1 Tax=Starkeya sp. ORNL1 TaxID=2709380 RepID=UPI0014634442|nr:polysaccharide deacetylase family protein [Starkeya sp. ORNL1]QJP12872.1 polysaccharide deacetylase family protein [Starkeya sp. ORNL1]
MRLLITLSLVVAGYCTTPLVAGQAAEATTESPPPCSNPQAIGTSRVIPVQTERTAGIGAFYFKRTLKLNPGEYLLTFDDGPAPATTPQILAILKSECIRATFFMIGKHAEAYPQIVAQLRDAGQVLASHTYSHIELTSMPLDQAIRDLKRGYAAVEHAAYGTSSDDDKPRFVRPPGQKLNPAIVAYTRQHQITLVTADISPQDWRNKAPQITMAVLHKALDQTDRGIIGLHDTQKNTVAMLPMLIAELKQRGAKLVAMEPR